MKNDEDIFYSLAEEASFEIARVRNSPDSQKAYLNKILALSEQAGRTEDELMEVIDFVHGMADRGALDQHTVLQHFTLPLLYEIDDVLFLTNVIGHLITTFAADDRNGHILGSRKIDRPVFESLAMIFKKLSQPTGSEREVYFASHLYKVIDRFYGLMTQKPQNDRALLALIAPYTSENIKAARRAMPAKKAPKLKL